VSLTFIHMTSKGPPPDDGETAAQEPSAFATTDWNMVGRAADAGSAEGRAALEALCRIYWRPLYCFARRRGLAQQDAEDLTQGFFEDLLAREGIARADPARGRFRTFLLVAFENFHANQRAHVRCLKSGGGCRIISIEELRRAECQLQEEPATTDSPETLFDRKWAMSLLEEALATVRREYAAVGKGALFNELKRVLWGGRGEVRYEDIARRLGATEGAIKMAVHRVRRRYREQLRIEVAKTLLHPEDADDEMRHLFSALGV
jgi:RNA polymerase sigma factor (sigma-70 family)